MAYPIALIQGASRGLGLEFCRYILKNNTSAAVIATCRNPDRAVDLRALMEHHPSRMTVLKLDVNREEDIGGAADRVKESFGRLDLIVNSSAMLHPSGKGETSLRDVSAQVKACATPVVCLITWMCLLITVSWRYISKMHYSIQCICSDVNNFSFQGIISTLTTNTVGPLIMAKYFAPLLQKGGGGFGQQPAERAKQHSGIIVNITAKVGSIGDNGSISVLSIYCIDSNCKCHYFYAGLGGWYSYRMSKAALNMATRNLSIELARSRPKVWFLPLSNIHTSKKIK